MQPASYDQLISALETVGLIGQMQNEQQLIVSAQRGAAWPDRGNSFWLSHKGGAWYLGTWLPVGYKISTDQDLVELCSACMVGKSAMYRVPEEVVARFQLQEVGDEEYERVFGIVN